MSRKNMPAGPGRPKGCKNKVPSDIKAMVIGALEKGGGQLWLEKQMDLNPTAFMTLLGKIIPTTLQGPGEDGKIFVEIRRFGTNNIA